MQRLLERVSFLGRQTVRIVLPSPCVVCSSDLPWRDREASCCATCWSALPALEGVRCRHCAAGWAGAPPDAPFLCLHCAAEPRDPLERIDAWGEYREGLERLLVAFKFERHDFLDRPLARLLVRRWRTWTETSFDSVVPVPMHPRKLRRRGYNQAELLARRFARESGLSLLHALRKVRENEPQSTLDRGARPANVRRAFEARAAVAVAGKSVILIDDICTTGATLRACAKALRAAGATRVVALTVARA